MTNNSFDEALRMMAALYGADGRFHRARVRAAMLELAANPEWGGIWLIEEGGATIGYVVLTTGFSLEFGGRFGLVDELFVKEGYRSCGAGSEALEFVAAECRRRRLSALRLEVAIQNTRALELYRRRGFGEPDRYFITRPV